MRNSPAKLAKRLSAYGCAQLLGERLKQVQVVFTTAASPVFDFLIPKLDEIVLKIDQHKQLKCRKPLREHHFIDITFRDPVINMDLVLDALHLKLIPYGFSILESKTRSEGNGFRFMLPGQLPPKFLVEDPVLRVYGEAAAINFVGHPTTCHNCFTTLYTFKVCQERERPPTEKQCFNCGAVGHLTAACPDRLWEMGSVQLVRVITIMIYVSGPRVITLHVWGRAMAPLSAGKTAATRLRERRVRCCRYAPRKVPNRRLLTLLRSGRVRRMRRRRRGVTLATYVARWITAPALAPRAVALIRQQQRREQRGVQPWSPAPCVVRRGMWCATAPTRTNRGLG